MNYAIKRMFLSNILHENSSDISHFTNDSSIKTIIIKCCNPYISNELILKLSKKIYNIDKDLIFFHNPKIPSNIEGIFLETTKTYITTNTDIISKNINILDLDKILNISKFENIDLIEQKVSLLEKIFKDTLNSINNENNNICNFYKDTVNENLILDLKNQISSLIENSTSSQNFKIDEFYISSISPYGFINFTNYLQNNKNIVFVLNDPFSTFKNSIISFIKDKLLCKNLSFSIFKNPLNPNIIDHLTIDSLNISIISNNILFNELIPGTQINSLYYENHSFNNINTFKLDTMLTSLKSISLLLKENLYLLNNNILTSNIHYKLSSLCNYIYTLLK